MPATAAANAGQEAMPLPSHRQADRTILQVRRTLSCALPPAREPARGSPTGEATARSLRGCQTVRMQLERSGSSTGCPVCTAHLARRVHWRGCGGRRRRAEQRCEGGPCLVRRRGGTAVGLPQLRVRRVC